MRKIIRGGARVALAVLAVAVIVLGLFWGLLGSQIPTVAQGESFDDWIVVRTSNAEAWPVTIEWVIMSDGRVEIVLDTIPPPTGPQKLPPPTGPQELPPLETYVVLYLYCGARMHLPDKPRQYEAAPVSVVDEPGLSTCGNRSPAPAVGKPRQIITLRPYDIISGTPYGTWAAEGAGQRVVRTPRITPLRVSTESYEVGYYAPPFESTASTVVTSRQSEFVDYVLPQALTAGSISSDDDSPFNLPDDTAEFAAVRFSSTFAEPSKTHGHDPGSLHSGFVRLIDPANQQGAQLLTLGAGVLLGVGASLVVEGLFYLARNEDRASDRERRRRERKIRQARA